MISDKKESLSEEEKRLTWLFQQASESINLMHAIAAKCQVAEIREAAIGFLAAAGSRAAGHLVALASDPARNAEVMTVATQSDQWPVYFSVWPDNRKIAERLIPLNKIGSGKMITHGKWSLETPQTRAAFVFVQHMQAGKTAKERFADSEKAAAYLLETHSLVLPLNIIELAASLPRVNRTNLPKWKAALWEYTCDRYGGIESMRKHSDWHHISKTIEDRKHGKTTPECMIRSRLYKALDQVLGVTRK